VQTNARAGIGVDAGAGIGVDAGAGIGVDAGAGIGVDAGAGIGAGIGADAGAGIGAVLDALADATRRAVWERLTRGSMTVGELAADLPVTRPAVSQHLKVLATAGLVTVTPSGTRRIYAARQDGLAALREYLDTMWRDGLESYAAAIDRQNQEKESGSA
jgi:DNA-binding transcriptional ArsR family regulator